MPSLGHVAVGLAAGRLHAGSQGPRLAPALAFTALATFPDLDFVSRAYLGAERGSVWAHRGAAHSLAVAVAAGVLSALVLGGLGRSRLRAAVTGALVAASHGVLDTITRGGSGAMLLWPLSDARLLAPISLLPAAPMGLRVLSPAGLDVALRELLLFSPLLAYAAWPRRPRGPSPRERMLDA
jgi:inner membrane protein